MVSERDGLTITQYYRWYNVPIQRWINISKYKAIKRIKAAVELDKVSAWEQKLKDNCLYNAVSNPQHWSKHLTLYSFADLSHRIEFESMYSLTTLIQITHTLSYSQVILITMKRTRDSLMTADILLDVFLSLLCDH